MAFRFNRVNLPTKYVATLCWRGDTLVDWLHGTTYGLDGTQSRRSRGYFYKFDAVAVSPSGNYGFIYERLGTKGLLVDPAGSIIREINRSYYHAHVHEFPIAFFSLPDEREVMAHCPDAYNRIEFDLLPDGQRLTARGPNSVADDFFHTRLAVNPGRTRLLSAGWVWSPVEAVAVFDLLAALRDPQTLDRCRQPPINSDVTAAAFGADDLLLVVTGLGAEAFNDEPDGPPDSVLNPGTIGAFDLAADRYVSIANLEEDAGTIMPLGAGHVIGFYDHPKVIEVATGRVLHRWPDLKSGHQNGSIIWHRQLPPPLALDPLHMRFAVPFEESIAVIQAVPAL